MNTTPQGPAMNTTPQAQTLKAQIMIRPAGADDAAALARLAALDSAGVPEGPLLLAEVDGELRAALSLTGGASIADPFFPTLELVGLLRAHARAAANPRARRRRPLQLSLARG